MSNLLVRKSLEILDYEEDISKEQKKKKRKNIRYQRVLDLIPTKHRIISKYDNTGRSSKTSVYETQKRILAEQDPTNKNVQRLLSLSCNHINSETASNLLHSAVRKKYVQQQEKPKESETVFTEEDFKKFEQEYVE